MKCFSKTKFIYGVLLIIISLFFITCNKQKTESSSSETKSATQTDSAQNNQDLTNNLSADQDKSNINSENKTKDQEKSNPNALDNSTKEGSDFKSDEYNVDEILDFNPKKPDQISKQEIKKFEKKIKKPPVTLKQKVVFNKDLRGVQGIAFNHSNEVDFINMIASGGWSNDIYIWNTVTGEVYQKITSAHDSDILSMIFDADGKYLFSAGLDNKIKVWDSRTGKLIKVFENFSKGILGIDLLDARNKLYIAAALLSGEVIITDFHTGREVVVFNHKPYATSVKFHNNGKWLASTGQDGKVRVWDLDTGQQIKEFNHGAKVNTVAFDPQEEFLVSGAWDNNAKVWDLHTGELLFTLKAHVAAIESVIFDPSGSYLFLGGRDGLISVWDPSTGDSLFGYKTNTRGVYNMTFSSDGRFLAIAGYDHTVRIYVLEEL